MPIWRKTHKAKRGRSSKMDPWCIGLSDPSLRLELRLRWLPQRLPERLRRTLRPAKRARLLCVNLAEGDSCDTSGGITRVTCRVPTKCSKTLSFCSSNSRSRKIDPNRSTFTKCVAFGAASSHELIASCNCRPNELGPVVFDRSKMLSTPSRSLAGKLAREQSCPKPPPMFKMSKVSALKRTVASSGTLVSGGSTARPLLGAPAPLLFRLFAKMQSFSATSSSRGAIE
mmetsp:Transcript_89557/g.142522  ORF Transcript_89557/g.142522 Transcript_89557/m.142522 type:complete len:228 (+) Transcript_89557:19-702(+)